MKQGLKFSNLSIHGFQKGEHFKQEAFQFLANEPVSATERFFRQKVVAQDQNHFIEVALVVFKNRISGQFKVDFLNQLVEDLFLDVFHPIDFAQDFLKVHVRQKIVHLIGPRIKGLMIRLLRIIIKDIRNKTFKFLLHELQVLLFDGRGGREVHRL